jgi:hypothetical protein
MTLALHILGPVVRGRRFCGEMRQAGTRSQYAAHPFFFSSLSLPAFEQLPAGVDGAKQQQHFHRILRAISAEHAPVWALDGKDLFYIALKAAFEFARQYRFLRRPTRVEARPECLQIHASETRPFGYCASLPIDSQVNISSRVATLKSALNPHAISRFVVGFIVDTFKGVTGAGKVSHIGQEVREMIPTRGYLDSPTTIVWIAFLLWISATLTHGFPRFVKLCSGHSMLSAHNGFYQVSWKSDDRLES